VLHRAGALLGLLSLGFALDTSSERFGVLRAMAALAVLPSAVGLLLVLLFSSF